MDTMKASAESLARLSLDTPEDERGLRMVRGATCAVLEAAGIARERIDDCLLVVGELSGNVIQHARSAAGWFRLTVECRAHDVLLTVADSGPGFELSSVPPIGGARGNGRVGGFGLPLVRTLCHHAEWYPSPTGTTVEAAVSLEPRVEEAMPSFDFDLDDFDGWELDGFPTELPRQRVQKDGLYLN
jgi:anti-sigma regulatory factor (Ser/Thr protein kinase)